jgi:hypothetical protein
MIRRLLPAAAAFAVVVAISASVFAGGGTQIPIRMKNVGPAAVAVSAGGSTATESQLISSARTLAANGISQFMVPAGAFNALAANPSTPSTVNKMRNFNTRTFKTIYLYAQQDGTTATLVGAPGGVKF